jgi:hypothetical protein
MASKKNLKKDIDYLITDVIMDCYECMEEHPEKDLSAYEQIINEIDALRDLLLERINQYDRKIHGRSNPYFLEIKKDLVIGIHSAHDNLMKLGC